MVRIGSLFSGAGGLDMAVEYVFGGETVWHCEPGLIDDGNGKLKPNAAVKILAARWPGVPNLGDVREIDWGSVEPVDVLCGGFPCQDVSAAGKKSGIRVGNRSGLWVQMAAAIEALRPPVVVIENVRGLLNAKAHRDVESVDPTMGDGSSGPVLRALGAVLGDLADIGYDARWSVVSAASVGAPHRRERVFIVAHPSGCGLPRRPQPDVGSRGGLEASRRDDARRRSGARPYPLTLLPTPASRDYKGGNATVRDGDGRRPVEISDLTRSRGEGGASDLPSTVVLLSTPQARDGRGAPKDGFCQASLPRDALEIASGWGKYEPAIRRWEALTRPVPEPTEPDSSGVKARIRSEFSEWMLGWPEGWVTNLPLTRTEKLVAIGNGVCPQQGAAALSWLLSLEAVA